MLDINTLEKEISVNEKCCIWGEAEYTTEFLNKYAESCLRLRNLPFVASLNIESENIYTEIRNSLSDIIRLINDGEKLIIAVKRMSILAIIEKTLSEFGKKKIFYYISGIQFEMIYNALYLSKKVQYYCEISITERCSLSCKNCSLFIPYFNKPKHTVLSNLFKDIDLFFSNIDYVFHFRLLGGEPFLHPAFSEILSYICENYRKKIDYFDIATNGTVNPTDEQMEVCKQNQITIAISDYNLNKNYKQRVISLIEELNNKGVSYQHNCFEHWFDIGFPFTGVSHPSEQECIDLYESCGTEWRNFFSGKLYYCSVCAFAQRGNLIEGWETDFIDFNKRVDPIKLLQFNLGMNPSGRNSLCGLCNGYRPSANKKSIRAAVQISKPEANRVASMLTKKER